MTGSFSRCTCSRTPPPPPSRSGDRARNREAPTRAASDPARVIARPRETSRPSAPNPPLEGKRTPEESRPPLLDFLSWEFPASSLANHSRAYTSSAGGGTRPSPLRGSRAKPARPGSSQIPPGTGRSRGAGCARRGRVDADGDPPIAGPVGRCEVPDPPLLLDVVVPPPVPSRLARSWDRSGFAA